MAHKDPPKYVYDIPYMDRKSLTRLLDHRDAWKELAEHMQYNTMTVLEIESDYSKRGISPSDNLLTYWGQQNHTILELFVLLYRMKHVSAMKILQTYVDPKYNVMITSTVTNSQLDRSSRSDQYSTENNEHYNPSPQSVPSEPNKKTDKIINKSENREGSQNTSDMLKIPFADLTEATEEWNKGNILGSGGFGVVYRGNLKKTPVAIKQSKSNQDSIENFRELNLLYKYRHDNVLALYGYSDDGPYFCLIYQLMVGGSLDERLRCKNNFPPLQWKRRLMIGLDVARGLQYLHTVSNPPLIHGDIKSANILLDASDNPRIGDFGLAKLGHEEFSRLKVDAVHGTLPYLPQDYIHSRELSAKVDVFSFGVVLFELATGLRAYCGNRTPKLLREHVPKYLERNPDYSGLQDFNLVRLHDSNEEICRKLIDIGLKCVQDKAADRPKMIEVFNDLEAE